MSEFRMGDQLRSVDTADIRFRLIAIALALSCTDAASQDGATASQPWIARISVVGGWGPDERFWVSSGGSSAYVNMADLRAIPCVGETSPETVLTIQNSLENLLAKGLIEPSSSSCRDDVQIGIFLAYASSDASTLNFIDTWFSDIPVCRRIPIAREFDEIAAIARESGAAQKAACLASATRPRAGVSDRPWTVRVNLRVSPPEPNQTVDPVGLRNETYWVNSAGETAVVDFGFVGNMPCVGAAEPAIVSRIEQSIDSLFALPAIEQGGASCPSTEYVYLEVSTGTPGSGSRFQNGFAEDPDCRRRPVPEPLDSLLAQIREAGNSARAVCHAEQ